MKQDRFTKSTKRVASQIKTPKRKIRELRKRPIAFYVHKWFITITLLIFGIITIRFAGDIAHPVHEMPRWFAGGVGFFWAIRTILQWTYYSKDHWKGNTSRTVIHWILTICYGGSAAAYLTAAFQ